MVILDILRNQISEGKVILILGSGASMEARDSKGNSPPSGSELAKMISEEFLGGKYNNAPLAQVGEYAINETDLLTVQTYIKQVFEPFRPSKAHLLMTTFKWWGICTTNYDLIIEKAYKENERKACQTPMPFIENGDRVEERFRDSNAVALLKLHGCVTRIANKNCPLILSTDQYLLYRKCRSRIFDHLMSWAYEKNVVFIGQSLQDPDLRAILLELSELGENRPRYYSVTPDADEIQQRFWESKKIATIKGTFGDFMKELNNKIPSPFRGIVKKLDEEVPIFEHFKTEGLCLSQPCKQFLDDDVEYVKSAFSTRIVRPKDFYKGYNPGWSAIEQDLDVRRALADKIILNHFLVEREYTGSFRFVLVKGHAGSGKTMLLRRIAWDTAKEYNCLCLYLREHGRIKVGPLKEIIDKCDKEIFLFIESVADRIGEIEYVANTIGDQGKHLTIICTERFNEWNVSCNTIEDLVTDTYELHYLSKKEIDGLLELLEKHAALGTLEGCNKKEREDAFKYRAGRQLLVALHEATLGKPFEEIIEDEYENIKPIEAQLIYLSICTLNRLNVPVRAGVISRIHAVPFTEFEKRLFKPLEEVVHTTYSEIIRTYVYETRHPDIAEMVFRRILSEPERRFDNVIRCLKALNIDYQTDLKAFRKIIHARTLLEVFPNYEHVNQIYEYAKEVAEDNPYLYHQMGIYEMNRPNGNLQNSELNLKKALLSKPNDSSIKHSLSELFLRRAESARNDLEKEAFLKEAEKGALDLTKNRSWSEHGYHTLVKINLERIESQMRKEKYESSVLEMLVSKTEKILADGLQQFPGNSYLLDADAKFAKLISDSERVKRSLNGAFIANPRNSFIALRLARIYMLDNDVDSTKKTLEKAINANSQEKSLHFAYAKLLLEINDPRIDTILHHLRMSFSSGDRNNNAKVLFGRQLFIQGKLDECQEFFKRLRESSAKNWQMNKLLFPLDGEFKGEIVKMEGSYCFIEREGSRDHVFAHISNNPEEVWSELVESSKIKFKISFAIRGPNAYDIELV